jgi:hypothetical protein
VCAALVAASRETVARVPGAWAALRPQVRIPARARRWLPAAGATFVATWALGGFHQAFGPSVSADQLGTGNTLVASAVAGAAQGATFAGSMRARSRAPGRATGPGSSPPST